MKAEKILEALGEIDEKFIEEAMNYNMKKKFNWKPIIAVAACAVFALAAIPVANHFANNDMVDGGTTAGTVAPAPGDEVEKIVVNGNFTVYESGYHASGDKMNAEHKIEFETDDEFEFFVDSQKKGMTKVVDFGGKTWKGNYQQTVSSPYYKDGYDVYFNEIDGEQFVFHIDVETGKLKSFNSTYSKSENVDTILNQEECYDIARNFLKLHVENIENYTLSFSRNVDWRDGYLFQFNRVLNGIVTSEYVNIGVRNNGEIYSYTFHSAGAMDNIDASEINMLVVNRVIDAKINSIYKNNYQFNYEAEEIILTRLVDGSFVFKCEISIEGKATESSEVGRDYCYLTVTMD